MYKNELAQAAKQFEGVNTDGPHRPAKPAYKPAFPIGEKAEAIITDVGIGKAPWAEMGSGDDRIFCKIEITHPISDRSETVFLPLVNLTERAAKWVKSQLKNIGYDIDETPLEDIEDHMESWIGKTVEVYTKINPRGKAQFYLNKVINETATDPNEFVPLDGGLADDDIPF